MTTHTHPTDAEFHGNANRVNSDDFDTAANCGRALHILWERIAVLEADAPKRGTWVGDSSRHASQWLCVCPETASDTPVNESGDAQCDWCGMLRPLRPLSALVAPPAPAPPVATCTAVSPSTSQPCALDAGHAGTHHKSAADTRWNVDAKPPVATAAADVGALAKRMRARATHPSGSACVVDKPDMLAILDELDGMRRDRDNADSEVDRMRSVLRGSAADVGRTLAERDAATRDLALERAAFERQSTAQEERDAAGAALAKEWEREIANAFGTERGDCETTAEAIARLVTERDEARAILSEIADVIGEGWSEYLPDSARLVVARLAAVESELASALARAESVPVLSGKCEELRAQIAKERKAVEAEFIAERDSILVALDACKADFATAHGEVAWLKTDRDAWRKRANEAESELIPMRSLLSDANAFRGDAERALATLRIQLELVPETDTLEAAQRRYVNARRERDALDAEVKRLRTQAVGA